MIIGVEGVSCTGKTTLAAALASALGDPPVVDCYYHCAPDPSWLPDPQAATGPEQLDNIAKLLRIEELRYLKTAEAVARGGDIILDRSVDTLLAHARAIGRLNGFDIDDEARELVRAHPIAVPDLTLLLHAQPTTLSARAKLRVNMPTIYYDPGFTLHFNRHFDHAMARRVMAVNTNVTFDRTLFTARTAIALHRDTLACANLLSGVS